MAIQWPLVVNRLVALLPTLSGWSGVVEVFDGAAYDVSLPVFATVGHSTDGIDTSSGSLQREMAPDGFRYVETGSVACQLAYSADSDDLAALRSQLFGLLNALDAAITADRRLGVLPADGMAWLDVNLTASQQMQGAAMAVAFTVNYQTTT